MKKEEIKICNVLEHYADGLRSLSDSLTDIKAIFDEYACEAEEGLGGYKESLKAALQNSIENQEEENSEEFNRGCEDAFKYAIEMFEKHLQLVNCNREAEVWLPYPENKPEEKGSFNVTVKSGKANVDYWDGYVWYFLGDNVIAFRELPAPYQERGVK